MNLLATPLVLPNPTVFTNVSSKKLRDWDLPPQVTPWRDRPSTEELAHRWEEFYKTWSSTGQGQGQSGKNAPVTVPAEHYRPYDLRILSPKEWEDLEKWFAKEGPKKLPGLCLDRSQATYVLAIGIISDGSLGASPDNSNRQTQYAQHGGTPERDSIGSNTASVSPTGHNSPADEFIGTGASNDPSAYTCTYLYRTHSIPTGQGRTREETPDYYYCRAAGVLPRAAVTTMLKYLAKKSLP
jgi:hypothetical protein